MKKVSLFLAALFCAIAFISCSGEASTETVYAYSDPALTGISIYKTPDITDYAVNSNLNLSGLIVTSTYSNGVTGIITDYTTDPANGSALTEAGEKTVTVTYKNLTASFKINVLESLPSAEAEIKEINILQQPSKTVYTKDEALDLSGLIVTATYNNGVTGIISDYTTDPENGSALTETGSTKVTVTYKNLTASFKISIFDSLPSTEAELIEINILQQPAKKLYAKGEQLDLSGLLVGASYSDKKASIVTGFTSVPAAGEELTEAGDQTVTISFGAFETSFKIKVAEQVLSNEAYLESISVYQRPVKTSYEEGDSFDSTGLIVTGTYSDGLIGLITDYTLNIAENEELSETGTKTVTVSKDSLSTSFTIEVVEKVVYGTVSGISVTVAASSDISISQTDITNGIKFTAPEGFVSYRWSVNSVNTGNEQEYILNTKDLISGNYEIFLIAKDEKNNYRSATIYVQVEN